MFIPAVNDTHQWGHTSPPSKARDADLEAYWTGMCADVIIYCGNDASWNLHKLTLGLRSTFFRDAFRDIANSNPFPGVYPGADGIDKVLFINGASKDEVTVALVYLYAEQYPLALLCTATPWECYRIFAVAHRIGLKGLQQVAMQGLMNSLQRLVSYLNVSLPQTDMQKSLSEILRIVLPAETVDQLQTIAMKVSSQPGVDGVGALKPVLFNFVTSAWMAVHQACINRPMLDLIYSSPRLTASWFTGVIQDRMLRKFSAEKLPDTAVTSQGFRLDQQPAILQG
ncbi:hypothetical protein PG996_006818 [Apiospora saccharicola]|uniref:BTB domain-containing protein n=1 Tax=Apiospora saccharicola TaxID=335842 RepID=A0ABR1V930_9PEZI